MWGVLPRDKVRRYRSIMSMHQTTEQAWLEWMGPDFETAYKARPLTRQWAYLQQGDHTVKC
eukprot:2543772-Rhodomonas_salina.1